MLRLFVEIFQIKIFLFMSGFDYEMSLIIINDLYIILNCLCIRKNLHSPVVQIFKQKIITFYK